MQLPDDYRWDPHLQLGPETEVLTSRVWPSFLISDSDIPDPQLKLSLSAAEFRRLYPVWGIRRKEDGRLVAFAQASQLALDPGAKDLPAAGWTYAIQAGAGKEVKNCLCLLVANVDPKARGLGLSEALIERAKLTTRELGFSTMVAPVRPTLKHSAPFTRMIDYVAKRTENGEYYDPWIQMHVRAGGKVANVASESVRIRATLGRWRQWTGLAIERSGEHILPKGLVPLRADLYTDIGVYSEPAVWLRYSL